MNEVACTGIEAALGKDSSALPIRGACSLPLYTARHSSRYELSLDTLTDGVPKVPKGCFEGFWHLWRPIIFGFLGYSYSVRHNH
jgi:hypothetical protein